MLCYSLKNATRAQSLADPRQSASLNLSASTSEDSPVPAALPQPSDIKMVEPSLTIALFRAFGRMLFVAGFFKFCQDIFIFVSPQLLK